MPIQAKEVLTKGLVIGLDDKYPDMIYVEIKFEDDISVEEWPDIHRQLQKRYKANFPYEEREKLWAFPNSFGFLGVREVSKKVAKQFSIPEETE